MNKEERMGSDIQVKCFDDKKAEQVLKTCPKIVRDYVKLLKENKDRWQRLTVEAINKLKQQTPISPSPVIKEITEDGVVYTITCMKTMRDFLTNKEAK